MTPEEFLEARIADDREASTTVRESWEAAAKERLLEAYRKYGATVYDAAGDPETDALAQAVHTLLRSLVISTVAVYREHPDFDREWLVVVWWGSSEGSPG